MASFDTVFKVNPPLRTPADVAAIKVGLLDGTLDAIATDHAPHTRQDKERPFLGAPRDARCRDSVCDRQHRT